MRSFDGVGHEYVIRTWQQERLMVELPAMVASYFVSRDFASLRVDDCLSVRFLWLVPDHRA